MTSHRPHGSWSAEQERRKSFEAKCQKYLSENPRTDNLDENPLINELASIYGADCSESTPSGYAALFALHVLRTPQGQNLYRIIDRKSHTVVSYKAFGNFVERHPALKPCFEDAVDGLVVMRHPNEICD